MILKKKKRIWVNINIMPPSFCLSFHPVCFPSTFPRQIPPSYIINPFSWIHRGWHSMAGALSPNTNHSVHKLGKSISHQQHFTVGRVVLGWSRSMNVPNFSQLFFLNLLTNLLYFHIYFRMNETELDNLILILIQFVICTFGIIANCFLAYIIAKNK